MPKYKGRLTKEEPYQGVQAALYEAGSGDVRLDVDVTDEDGYFEFLDIEPGEYQVRFFGRNYDEQDYVDIEVFEKGNFLSRHYLRPADGTVIKNGSGELSFEVVRFNGNIQEIATSGNVKIYRKVNGSYVAINSSDTGVVGDNFNGYEITVNADFISGSETLYAVDNSGDSPIEYDSVSLADITDGKGFVAWVEVTSYMTSFNPDAEGTNKYEPQTITLTPKFAFEGDIIDPNADSNFSFTQEGLPTADTPNGISVDSTTGKVEVGAADYFDSELSYTGNWTATYDDNKKYTTSTTETVYVAKQGSDAQFLRLNSSAQVLQITQDGGKNPASISFDAISQGISSEQPK